MKSILAGLTLSLWILSFPGYTQTEKPEVFCVPLAKARLLVADALRLRVADSLNNVQSSHIALLEVQYNSAYSSFTNLLKIEQEKTKLQQEINLHNEFLVSSYKAENDLLKKQVRKLKWQRAGLGVLTVVVIVLSL